MASALKSRNIRNKLKRDGQISPIIDIVLDHLERVEIIQNALYAEYQTNAILSSYTNKAGATNTVVNPAVKEYKAYCQQFNNLIKTLDTLIGSPRNEGVPPTPDPYMLLRDRKLQKQDATKKN